MQGQHRRLARSGTGHDQQRRTLMQDGGPLLWVEPVEQGRTRAEVSSETGVRAEVIIVDQGYRAPATSVFGHSSRPRMPRHCPGEGYDGLQRCKARRT